MSYVICDDDTTPKMFETQYTDLTKLTPRNIALLEKLRVALLAKKFPAFYGPRGLIAIFIRTSHWSLS
jgi:hypothetical protein